MLRLAIQKKGRLSEESLGLLKKCGIKYALGKGKLKATANNFPLEFLFLRDDDIPRYVADGVADIGIVGENEVYEKNMDVEVVKKLGFAGCRLSIAVPKGEEYTSIKDLDGRSIATSYPNILHTYLDKHEIKAETHEISGSVEIAPGIGLADTICDLVSSGSTLFSNGLKEVETILESEAALIKTVKLSEEKANTLKRLLFRIEAVQTGQKNKYVLLNAPNDKVQEILKILPGMRSPTILPLAEKNWSSVHSVIKEKEFWEVIDQLKAAGAEGILVTAIEKMIL